MIALIVLLGVAVALLVIGLGERFAPGRVGSARGVACLVGLVAALAGAGEAGFGFEVDGLSRAVLAVLFVVTGTGGAGLAWVAGAVAFAMMATDGAVLVAAVAGAIAAGAMAAGAVPGKARGSRAGWGGVACLAVAVLAAGWQGGALDLRFAAMRGVGAQGWLVLMATLAAAVPCWRQLPGGLGGVLGFYLVGRLLLDVAGTGTPGWWGAPVLILGLAGAVWGARRVGTVRDAEEVAAAAGVAGQGLAVIGLGVALLARGSDLAGLEALGAAGGLLQLMCWALWGGLLTLCLRVVRAGAGSGELARMGGVLRRAPGTGISVLVALASMGAWPVSAGFAGVWLGLQALLGAGRLGGTVWLALVAACLGVLGFALAWLASGAVRLGGMVLLGAPRAGRAWVTPGRGVLAGMGGLTLAVVGAGLWPGVVLGFVQPGVRVLAAGGEARGGVWSVAGVSDGPGLVALIPGVLLVAAVAGVAWGGRIPVEAGAPPGSPPWRGGLAGDAVGRENAWQVPSGLPAQWRAVRLVLAPWMGLVALGLVLAVVLGWAAR